MPRVYNNVIFDGGKFGANPLYEEEEEDGIPAGYIEDDYSFSQSESESLTGSSETSLDEFDELDEDEDPPMEPPYTTWREHDAYVNQCPKAELLNAHELYTQSKAFVRRSRRLNPALPRGTGVGLVDVVVEGALAATARDFPTQRGTYLILVAVPGAVRASSNDFPCKWIPVYYGEGAGEEGLRQRMKAYCHPRTGRGTFHPAPNEPFKYHAFRAFQARGFSIQIRYQIYDDCASLETHVLKSFDLPLNKKKKATPSYRLPEIPCLVQTRAGLRWVRRGLEDFQCVVDMPPAHSGIRLASYYNLPDVAQTQPPAAGHRPASARPPSSNRAATAGVSPAQPDLEELLAVFTAPTTTLKNILVGDRRKVLQLLLKLESRGEPTNANLKAVLCGSTYMSRAQRIQALQVVQAFMHSPTRPAGTPRQGPAAAASGSRPASASGSRPASARTSSNMPARATARLTLPRSELQKLLALFSASTATYIAVLQRRQVLQLVNELEKLSMTDQYADLKQVLNSSRSYMSRDHRNQAKAIVQAFLVVA